jgi:hypothetical protein
VGYFSYICKGCGTPIRNNDLIGEYCILIHVRKGTELGRVAGEYDSYGSVYGQNIHKGFRNDVKGHPNSKYAIYEDENSGDEKSGIVAWHKLCYEQATYSKRKDFRKSIRDPYKGLGYVRRGFLED